MKGRTVADRFDYQYSEEELGEIAKKVEAVAPKAQELHLVFNNNRSNYAPKASPPNCSRSFSRTGNCW